MKPLLISATALALLAGPALAQYGGGAQNSGGPYGSYQRSQGYYGGYGYYAPPPHYGPPAYVGGYYGGEGCMVVRRRIDPWGRVYLRRVWVC
jgi:hypothetical protein